MNDQVWVAPDGRREMRILLRRQGKMSELIRRIPCLFERTQHEIRKNTFLGLAGDFLRQSLVVLRANINFLGCRKAHAHRTRAPLLRAAGASVARKRLHAAVPDRYSPLG